MVRLIVSPTRSGSTALLRCFENNPAVARTYHQPAKSGFRGGRDFEYWFFQLDVANSKKIYIAKETIGGFERREAGFSPLPTRSAAPAVGSWHLSPLAIREVMPLVLLRDPLHTWASIAALNRYSKGRSPFFSPYELFERSFRNVCAFLEDARQAQFPVNVLTLEMLGLRPEELLMELCRRWRIPWSPEMRDWVNPYGSRTWYSDETQDRMRTDPRFQKSKEKLERSKRFEYRAPEVIEVERSRADEIKRNLQPLYESAAAYAAQDFAGV